MKKLMFTISLFLFCIAAIANISAGNYYVTATGETLSCKKIRLGKDITTAVLDNGQKVTVPTAHIKMYQLKGKIYEKLPLYANNQKTSKEVFMQFIGIRSGLKLYKYSKFVEGYDKATGAYSAPSLVDYYFVFRGDKFWVEVTSQNYPTLFEFFRINVRES
ncbi:MAG: hypothetical protein Q8928_01065 [Bacteroidota bacterium]|nr:hypothetical protein [Bacteroidota bacterium]